MSTTNQIYEISILGRIVWNLHSLNNEGTIGNVTEPRSVKIIDPNTGKIITTDGISGEMLKHIHCEKMWEIVSKKGNNLCSGCQRLEPERGFQDDGIQKAKDFNEASSKAIRKCVICDTHGFLFPKGKITGSRDSLISFGWSIGKGSVARDIHTHARHAVGERGRQEGEDEISTQMVYHRPTRSGVYALISVFQPWRIGINNIDMNYLIGDEDRKRRYKLALKAYQAMFLKTDGAMSSTRLPHVQNFEGVIVISKTNFPAPVVSPLSDSYKDDLKAINDELKLFEIKYFNSVVEFVRTINSLLEAVPYKI